ncbi:hypothetical protein BGX27_006840, partial [Mortierella sp. AM989]
DTRKASPLYDAMLLCRSSMFAIFQHVDASHKRHWIDGDQEILHDATIWFKKVTEGGVVAGIEAIRADPFRIRWISDLLYDRLKLIRVGGIDPGWDENSYTSIWVNLDITSLYTGFDGLISAAYANENHFTPSAWRRSL